MKNSLIIAIVTRVTVVMTLTWLLGCALALLVMQDEMGEAFDSGLQQTAHRILPLAVDYLFEHGDGPAPHRMPVTNSVPNDEFVAYQIRDAKGAVLVQSFEAGIGAFSAPLKPGFFEDDKFRYYTETTISDSLFIQVAEPVAHRHEALRESISAIIAPLVVLIPLSIIGIWWSVRRGLRPVTLLQEDIRNRGSGNMMPIDRPELPDELHPIVIAVNNLLARLKSALTAERNFAANSAHELRTPIAAALAQTQRLRAEMPAQDANTARAEHIETSLHRLKRLSEKLLQLSRAEAGVAVVGDLQDLSPALLLVIEDFSRDPRYIHRIAVDFTGHDTLLGKIDIDAFAICLRNVIENALIHSNDDDPVRIWASGGTEAIPASIHVANQSPVVPPRILAKLTERFERNNPSSKGSGLGLAIVDTIMQQAGGKLVLLSPAHNRDSGFEAVLQLPGDDNSAA
ncbi:hypothetical protein TMES_14570 [Thalassospira mesophila]|uniref:histidine kinase n=2 Tax=Thalassospira mesophila TaxID=1293891 RepID=A0A1Y2KYG6_9PROT|nr:hypothetical protein TMES_14570 [Thalassospira mesophila]